MTIKTKATTDEYREGWERVFGERRDRCFGCKYLRTKRGKRICALPKWDYCYEKEHIND